MRRRHAGLTLRLFLIMGWSLSAQHTAPVREVVTTPSSSASLVQGERLFMTHCAPCHGFRGEGGRGPSLAVALLPRAPDDDALLRIIRRGIAGTEMPPSRLENAEILQIAAWVRHLGKLPAEGVSGNPLQGEKLYLEKGGCVACHAIRGRGGVVGPDLTDIGLRRSASYLRTALIQPAADVPRSFRIYRSDVSLAEGFLQVRLRAKDGGDVVGVRVNEDAFSIQVRDLTGQLHSFFKSELDELHKERGQSPMPSYEGVFGAAELDDLVAYLASLRTPP
jgi:cytochrome c oxidase cbb3-type subunit III